MPALRSPTRYLPILKKTAVSKRAAVPQAAAFAKAFLRDWQRLTHSGRHDMVRLQEAMLFIANDALLGPEWLDHALKGTGSITRNVASGGTSC